MNFEDIKKSVLQITGDKRFQIGLTVILMLFILFSSVQIRTSNLPLLKDQTTGEYMTLALDPMYFQRIAETIVENDGVLPEHDDMRFYPGSETPWHPEIMPDVVVGMWKMTSAINPEVTLQYIHVISPVVFFAIGLIIFFFLALVLTKSKFAAVLASAFLAYSPAYLYRTMAGFSDHESIGMVAFFFVLLIYTLAMKFLTKNNSKMWWAALGGLATGFGTALTVASWGGVANFLHLIIPISFFLIWMVNVKNERKAKEFSLKGLSFYIAWIIFTIGFGFMLGQGNLLNEFLGSSNIASLAILGFIIVDTILIYSGFEFIKKKYRTLYSLGLTGILGAIALPFLGKSIFDVVVRIYQFLIAPLERGNRVDLTVAENSQPFLINWIGNMGPQVFWLFFLGTVLFGVYLAHKIKDKKHAFGFGASYIFMVFAIIFSKYSSSSMLNGDNFISRTLYIVGFLTFWIYFFHIYFKDKLEWTSIDAVLFGVILYVIIAGRAATRVFFAITPFVCLIAAYFIIRVIKELKVSKDEIMKIILVSALIISLVVSGIAINGTYKSIEQQAQYTGPSANAQWQNAMSWVRNNTDESSLFSHWWDYGYWVQTLGERRTIADGGHFHGGYNGNHVLGRYLLTTQTPQSAYAVFNTLEVTHLLIDQTELGKYSAYSKIGSDDDWDRFSVIPQGTYDPSQIRETKDANVIIYNVQGMVDEDIYYTNEANEEIFLPGPTYDRLGNPSPKSYLGAVFYEVANNTLRQPTGVYVYNNVQHQIPIRYVYINGEIIDFGSGLDAVTFMLPSVRGNGIDPIGGMIYLSPKVQKSLYARTYLMDNAFGDYDELNLVHAEADPTVASIKAQGAPIGDFIYYGGLRGPIKIWDVTEAAEKGAVVEEFFNQDPTKYAELDYLFE